MPKRTKKPEQIDEAVARATVMQLLPGEAIDFTKPPKRCKCGGRFGWGEVVIGYSWNGTGPRWFRGEEHVAHAACDGGDRAAKAASP